MRIFDKTIVKEVLFLISNCASARALGINLAELDLILRYESDGSS